jgi:hypothetical protein
MTNIILVTKDYGTHKYESYFQKVPDVYCPACGQQGIYEEEGEGDYYMGSVSVCILCNSSHYLSNCGVKNGATVIERQAIEQIKKVVE